MDLESSGSKIKLISGQSSPVSTNQLDVMETKGPPSSFIHVGEDDPDEIPDVHDSSLESDTFENEPRPKTPSKEAWSENPANENDGSNMTFKEFVDGSTLHGVKYVFEGGSRRWVWLLCVLTAFAFFVSQVIIRSFDYLDYKSNVNVEVIYEPSVTFPGVTICNQNNFRISATAEMGAYDFIDTVYSANDISTLPMSSFDVDHIDTSTFLTRSAHQLEDLIERCTWQKKPCDLKRDFVQRITDLGVCYSFNSNDSNIAELQESGTSVGLSLVMNVEQYEYMKGPQNDAGVKILLHEQKETPKLRDLGFAVAPGMHTLVDIETTKVTNLPDPYGDCISDAQPISNCEVQCEANFIGRFCGCIPPYMIQPDSNQTTCDMISTFQCVPQGLDMLHVSDSSCNCSVPCERTNFKPSLSYAQLSQFNIERLALEDEERENFIRDKFMHARETSQRVISHIAQTDDDQIDAILGFVSNIRSILSSNFDMMTNSTKLSSHYGIADMVQFGYQSFANDVELMNTLLYENHKIKVDKLHKNIDDNIQTIQPLIDHVVNFLNLESEVFDPENTYLEIMLRCTENGFYTYCNNSVVAEKNENERKKYDLCEPRSKRSLDFKENDSSISRPRKKRALNNPTTPMVNDNTNAYTVEPTSWSSTAVLWDGEEKVDGNSYLPSISWQSPCVNYSAMFESYSSMMNYRFPPLEWSWFPYRWDYVNYCKKPENQNECGYVATQTDYCDLEKNWPECAFLGHRHVCHCLGYHFSKKSSLYQHENSYLYVGTNGNASDTFDKTIALKNLEKLESTYIADIENIFGNSHTSATDQDEYYICENVLKFFKGNTLKTIYNVFEWFGQFFDMTYSYPANPLRLDGFINILTNMTRNMITSKLVGGFNTLKTTMEACKWPEYYSNFFTSASTNAEEKAKFNTFSTYAQTALQHFMSVKLLFTKMSNAYIAFDNYFNNVFLKELMQLQVYKEHGITKKKLADHLTSPAFEKQLEKFNELANAFLLSAVSLNTELREIDYRLLEGYDSLYTLRLPVMNDDQFFSTKVWANLISKSQNNTVVDLMKNYKDDRSATFHQVLEHLFTPFMTYPKYTRQKLETQIEGFRASIDLLQTNLKKYLEGSIMDEAFLMENFLQVDIFFMELNYEQITQQAAFELPSLFSEVGGFMGLLLGGSVMTLFELLDYISTMVLTYMHRKKRVAPIEKEPAHPTKEQASPINEKKTDIFQFHCQ